MKHSKLLNKLASLFIFFNSSKIHFLIIGIDAYEASLELGADGVKKGRKLGKFVSFSSLINLYIFFSCFY
jgi:hypothetical protein